MNTTPGRKKKGGERPYVRPAGLFQDVYLSGKECAIISMKNFIIITLSLVVSLPVSGIAQDVIGTELKTNLPDYLYGNGREIPVTDYSGGSWAASPDGHWWAFGEFDNLWLIPTGGGEAVNVLSDGLLDFEHYIKNFYCLDFSPDGSSIALTAHMYDTSKGAVIDEYDKNTGRYAVTSYPITIVGIADITTKELTILDYGVRPYWSPDGKLIAYIVRDWREFIPGLETEFEPYLSVYDTGSGTKEKITAVDYASWRRAFAFGPDGCLYWSEEDDSTHTTYIKRTVPFSGVSEFVCTIYSDKNLWLWEFHISPDGNWLLMQEGFQYVYLCNLKTGDVFNAITRASIADDTGADSYEITDKGEMIYTMNREYAAPDTNVVYHFSNPFWSSDGQSFGCVVDLTGEYDFYNGKTFLFDFDPFLYYAGESIIVEENIPEAFLTLGAFPNPFNTSTTLEFTLPEAGDVELTIYNLAGQQVRTLASGAFSAGTHAVQWDGCDNHGLPVSSGIYLSRLTAGDKAVTSRMTLVK